MRPVEVDVSILADVWKHSTQKRCQAVRVWTSTLYGLQVCSQKVDLAMSTSIVYNYVSTHLLRPNAKFEIEDAFPDCRQHVHRTHWTIFENSRDFEIVGAWS